MAPVILYLDLMSQPSRAVLLFCRVNNVDAEVKLVNIFKGEQRRPEYRGMACVTSLQATAPAEIVFLSPIPEDTRYRLSPHTRSYAIVLKAAASLHHIPDVNPLAKVPAINDSGFRLQESHAILRYLAAAKATASHWYPADLTRRALVDSILDWHHNNLRRGSAGLILHKVLAPALGIPLDAKVAEDSRKVLHSALSTMNRVWITKPAPFLGGLPQPTIADISLACELTQLKLLGPEEEATILEPYPSVRAWMSAIQMWTAPHFGEVHKILVRAAAVAEKRREKLAST